jgi:hypothetical protein
MSETVTAPRARVFRKLSTPHTRALLIYLFNCCEVNG